jgi:phytoene desaturase
MNYADIVGGTWYPKGGMYKVVEAMYQVALELGVRFQFNEPVEQILLDGNRAKGVRTTKGVYDADVVVGGADYQFIESKLLPASHRSYSPRYWEKRLMAPSCLLYYVGINKKIQGIPHHLLFFDVPFDKHAEEIYTTIKWPTAPSFYVSASSVTDPTVAPEGSEALVFLIPVAAGLSDDTESLRETYFQLILQRFEQHIGQSVAEHVVFKRSFAYTDFVNDYHSFKGNAYGLANTLMQTAIFRPSCRSKKVKNLFYTGQLTVPGPGVPPSLISGEVVAHEALKFIQ